MTTLIIIFTIFILIISTYLLFILSSFLSTKFYPEESGKLSTKPNKYVIFLVILSFLLIIVSPFLPFLLTRKAATSDFDFTTTGQIGDTIGGIMGTVIGLVAVFVTGLAFYMQYRANILQVLLVKEQIDESQRQFKSQLENQDEQAKKEQFEGQFFELLRLHKENVNELTIVGFLSNDSEKGSEDAEHKKGMTDNKEVKGRQVFFVMSEIFETLLGYTKKIPSSKLTKNNYDEAYLIFFWGIKYIGKVNLELQKKLLGIGAFENIGFGKFIQYNGISFSLGHYFRHLFMTVKFVVESDIITKHEEKMKYLKILRAQLSNHEQIMLFYNWLSDYGSEWEDDNNKFFTDYKMIHNLWNQQLFQDQYIVNTVNELIDIYNAKYKNKPTYRPLFEFQGGDFNMKMDDVPDI